MESGHPRSPSGAGSRVESFRHAFHGLVFLLRSQPNARIHAAATIGALALGLALRIETLEWGLLLLTLAAVWSAEAVNTALEQLCDRVSPDHHPQIGRAKDLAAAAVLVAALASAGIGLLIFAPPLFGLVAGEP